MQAGTTDDRLGRRISTHPVATRSRWISGLVGVLSLVLGAALVGYVIVEPFGTKTDGKLLGVGGIGLVAGVWLIGSHLTRAVRGGWHESFEVHRHGLVHRGWRVRSWTWQQVTTVRVPYLIALFASTSAGLIWYLAVTQSRSTPLLLAAWASPFGLIFAIYLFSRRPRG